MMNALRTPDTRFKNLTDYPFAAHYFETQNLRVHYVDEGRRDAGVTFLCLHGEPTWSYLYRKMIPMLAKAGRVLAPDLIGFGKSDKPTRIEDYSYRLHIETLKAFLAHTEAKNIILVCQDWGGILGLPLAMQAEHLFKGLVIMNTGLPDPTAVDWLNPASWLGAAGFMAWRTLATSLSDMPVGHIVSGGCWPPMRLDAVTRSAYDAPFPDKSYKAGAESFPLLVPITPNHDSLPYIQQARQRIEQSALPKLILFSNRDPITWSQREYFTGLRNVVADIRIEGAGHFLQEDKGEEISQRILENFGG